MEMDKYTRKSLEVVEKAKEKALEYDNQELTQMHLLAGLLEIDDSLIAKIFEKMGVNVTGAVNAVEDKLARLPNVSGGNMYAGNNFSKALIQAEKEAKQMGDTYVSLILIPPLLPPWSNACRLVVFSLQSLDQFVKKKIHRYVEINYFFPHICG